MPKGNEVEKTKKVRRPAAEVAADHMRRASEIAQRRLEQIQAAKERLNEQHMKLSREEQEIHAMLGTDLASGPTE